MIRINKGILKRTLCYRPKPYEVAESEEKDEIDSHGTHYWRKQLNSGEDYEKLKFNVWHDWYHS